MIRTLLFSRLYPNAAQPGFGLFVEERLRQLLARHPVEARVCAPVPWFPFASAAFGRFGTFARVPPAEVRDGIPCLHPRYLSVPAGVNAAPLLMAAAAARRLRAEHWPFALIDAHFFFPDGVAAALLGKWLGKPVVITARGSDINHFAEHPVARKQIQWAAGRAAAVIAVSEALAERLRELGVDGQKITVLRNGVDLQEFSIHPAADDYRKRHVSCSRLLLAVGNLVPLKGMDLVIRALPLLEDTELLIVGDGPERRALEGLAVRLGVAGRVRFTGSVPRSELPLYYSSADATVLASSREGMPNVILESLACGTPVIGSPVGGIPEVLCVPEAGRLLAERTPEAIAKAARALLADPPPAEAVRAYAQRFGWDEPSTGQWEIFRRVAA